MSNRIWRRVLPVGIVCGAVVAGACGTDRPDNIDVASTSSAITDGQPEDAQAQGMPWVKKWDNGKYDDDGSAVLLSNEWVLTAQHIASRADYPTWRSKFAMRNSTGGGIQERDPLPDQMFDHPTRDVALMKLRTPFVIGGQVDPRHQRRAERTYACVQQSSREVLRLRAYRNVPRLA